MTERASLSLGPISHNYFTTHRPGGNVLRSWAIVYLESTLQHLVLLQAVLAELLAHVVAYKMGDATL